MKISSGLVIAGLALTVAIGSYTFLSLESQQPVRAQDGAALADAAAPDAISVAASEEFDIDQWQADMRARNAETCKTLWEVHRINGRTWKQLAENDRLLGIAPDPIKQKEFEAQHEAARVATQKACGNPS